MKIRLFHNLRLTGYQPSEFQSKELTKLAVETIGPLGRMISSSKYSYTQLYPNNQPVFNANVCVETTHVFKVGKKLFRIGKRVEKVWFGDLDITLDAPKLQEFADKSGLTVYVLHERDARFDTENDPRLDNAVVMYVPQN